MVTQTNGRLSAWMLSAEKMGQGGTILRSCESMEGELDQPLPPSTTAPGIVRFGRALLFRCPVCGGGGIFKNWFKLHDTCPTCGFVYARGEHGYQLGSMALNLVVPLIIWFF